tara:strand:+ start:1048 stop:1191 length:144 start_codon:yes stop_codon:yes gene_type:complete
MNLPIIKSFYWSFVFNWVITTDTSGERNGQHHQGKENNAYFVHAPAL